MSKEINLFEVASRQKLRFMTNKGLVTVEDLWDLPLSVVDATAQNVKAQLDEVQGESFLRNRKEVDKNTENALRLEVLKYIINVRQDEDEIKVIAREKAARRRQLIDLLAQRDAEADSKMTREDILKELEGL